MAKSAEKLEKVEKVGKSSEKWGKVRKSGEKLEKWRKVGISGESWGKVRKRGEKRRKAGKCWKKWGYFSQNGRRRTFWMTKNHFRSHFSPFQIKTKLFFFKMAASGHFGSPICAKNNRVLPLCVINGYAKYEVDR